jgi:hypothetical protein
MAKKGTKGSKASTYAKGMPMHTVEEMAEMKQPVKMGGKKK